MSYLYLFIHVWSYVCTSSEVPVQLMQTYSKSPLHTSQSLEFFSHPTYCPKTLQYVEQSCTLVHDRFLDVGIVCCLHLRDHTI